MNIELIQERGRCLQERAKLPKVVALMKRNAAITVALQDVEAKIGPLADIVRWAAEAAQVLTCPNCDALVKLKDGELAPADPQAQDFVRAPEDVEAARVELEQLEKQGDELRSEHLKNLGIIHETSKRASALKQRIIEIDRELHPPEATS